LEIPQAVLSAYQHDTLIQALEYFQLLEFFVFKGLFFN
jgi:hypothetical protein